MTDFYTFVHPLMQILLELLEALRCLIYLRYY